MGSSRTALVFDVVALVACALSARAGYYELFVDVPRVHAARWFDPWGMPKDALVILFGAALLGALAALSLLVVFRTSSAGRTAARLVEVASVAATLAAWLAWTMDFVRSAGHFG